MEALTYEGLEKKLSSQVTIHNETIIIVSTFFNNLGEWAFMDIYNVEIKEVSFLDLLCVEDRSLVRKSKSPTKPFDPFNFSLAPTY